MPGCRPFARKRGFTVPVGSWIAVEARVLGPLVASQPGIAAVMRPEDARSLIENADGRSGLLAWRVLFYALWHQIHRRGADPRQPLADILAEQA
jgi:asparagine synthase (glutamine-hydrolysing)